jgi:hypothetical protein
MAVVVVRVWDSGADTRISLPFGEFYGPGSAPMKVAVRDIHAHTDNGTASAMLTVDLICAGLCLPGAQSMSVIPQQ